MELCVTLAKKLGVSRHDTDRGGGCRLFKVKVSETEPKINPDQTSLSTISDPDPQVALFSPPANNFQQPRLGATYTPDETETDKTKNLNPPP